MSKWVLRRNGTIWSVNSVQQLAADGVTPLPDQELLEDNDPELVAHLNPTPIDYSNTDNLSRTLKAFGLVVADWTSHTPNQLKTAFKAKYDSLNGNGGGGGK